MTTKKAQSFPDALRYLEENVGRIGGRSPEQAQARRTFVDGRTLDEIGVIVGWLENQECNGSAPAGLLLTMLARDEHDAAKAARKSGEAVPPLPFMEAITRRNTEMTSTTTRNGNGGTARKQAADVRFTHNGKLMAMSNNRLSTQAFHFTKDIDGKKRLDVREFEALLRKLGVENPYAPGWQVELPNGHTVGAVKEGETPTPVAAKPKAAKPAKTTAPRAAKSTTAKKAPAKKAAAKSNVVPIRKPAPKKSTAKKGAASTPTKKAPVPRKQMAAVPARKATKRVTAKRV